MLYSYAGMPEKGLALYKRMEVSAVDSGVAEVSPEDDSQLPVLGSSQGVVPPSATERADDKKPSPETEPAVTMEDVATPVPESDEAGTPSNAILKQNTMSGLSIVLTLISIILAFRSVLASFPSVTPLTFVHSISIIEIMGLIEGACTSCQDAENAPDGGGLAGRWWRGWANVRRSFSTVACVRT